MAWGHDDFSVARHRAIRENATFVETSHLHRRLGRDADIYVER
jgi:hypothetical protein